MKNTKFSYTSSIIIAAVLALILISCNEDNNPAGGSFEQLDTSSFVYPMTIGSRWNYDRSFTVENIRPDSIRYLFTDFPVYGGGFVAIVGDTVIGSFNAKCFYEEYNEYSLNDTNTWYKRSYMNNDTNGLIGYAYRIAYGGSGIPYGPVNSIGFVKFKSRFRSLYELSASVEINSPARKGDDSLIIENPPVISLKYPVMAGEQWFFKTIQNFTDYYKKNIEFVNLNLPAGKISCIKNERIMTAFAEDFDLFDYYSKFGQLKRDYMFKNVLVTTITHPDGVGFIDYRDTYTISTFAIAK